MGGLVNKMLLSIQLGDISISLTDLYFALSIIAILSICIIVIHTKNITIKDLQDNHNTTINLLRALEPTKPLENNLTDLLNVISSVVEAPSYGFYLLDDKTSSYILKAVRHMTNEGSEIGPAYSGLLPYKKETYFMPTTLPADIAGNKAEFKKEGEVPLIILTVKGKKGVILIGPLKKAPKSAIKLLSVITDEVQPILDSLLKTENMKRQVKSVVSSDKAVKSISNVFADFNGMLDMIMGISIKTIGAAGGLFINEEEGNYKLEIARGFDNQTEKLIREDKSVLLTLGNIIGNEKFVSISKKERQFFKLPPYFVAVDAQTLLMANVATESGRGIALFWYSDNPDVKEYQITALKVMTKRMGDIINSHIRFKELSDSYIDILKMLARLIDNLKPNTAGYSELMYRYAVIICKELKLSVKQTKDIALAAYLSNIGVIGLSDELLFKKGQYTEIEYETMKLHADAGASIIEATIGNHDVADYIRYHHERIDGYGYPAGLSGEGIPLGARIIAVIQTFLAKIITREYREALPFDKAIKQLQAASGTQLDARVVNALVNWFEKKQKESQNS